jgi:hypothetical protein
MQALHFRPEMTLAGTFRCSCFCPRRERNMTDDPLQRRSGESIGWAFAVLAGLLLLIALGWGAGSNGRGWGDQMAHMPPPLPEPSMDGPASRRWSPPPSAFR